MVARQECPRLRYLNYHYGGKGLARNAMSLPLVNGIYVHAGLAEVLQGVPIDVAVMNAVSNYQVEVGNRGIYGLEEEQHLINEQSMLIACLIIGWTKTRLPLILEEYEIVSVEEEWEWELAPGMVQMLRLDALLKRKSDGMIFILEFKTAALTGYAWQQQWERNIQFMSYCKAVEEVKGVEVGGVLVEGLVKGIRRKDTAQRSPFLGQTLQSSPFCYLYRTELDGQPVYDPEYQAGKGWRKVRTWEHLSAEDVVNKILPEATVRAQFVNLPPIAPNPAQTARWRRQVVTQELRFAKALMEVATVEQQLADDLESGIEEDIHESRVKLDELLDFYFPQHDNHCMRYGSPCGYSDICFNELVAEDPIGSGLYIPRQPHHTTEE